MPKDDIIRVGSVLKHRHYPIYTILLKNNQLMVVHNTAPTYAAMRVGFQFVFINMGQWIKLS